MNCTIHFVKFGELKPAVIPANELWLDVGNALESGCIDHHHVEGYSSTLDALVQHPDCLKRLKECVDEDRPIIVYMHNRPDMDCVVSWYAAQVYLVKGEEEFRSLFAPEGAWYPLLTYVNDIDAGRNKVTDYPTLYAVFSLLDNGKNYTPRTDYMVLDKAMKLLDIALGLLQENKIDLVTYNLEKHLPSEFRQACQEINSYSFKGELKSKAVDFYSIPLWKKTGEKMTIESVKAALWKHIPASTNSYNGARKMGAILTVVPYHIKGENDENITQAIISINRDLDINKEYTLRPLAEIIEQMEQMEENRLQEQTGVYRRNHSHPRAKDGILGKMPFAATSDPWFIRPEEDLIDAPGIFSILEYRDILEVIKKNGSAVSSAYAIRIARDEKKLIRQWNDVPLSTWQKENSEILAREQEHTLIFAQLDASLICRSNAILEAYCMNLIGKPYHERKPESLHFADYRTCIYTDLKCTIVLVATADNMPLESLPIAKLLGLPASNASDSLCQSTFVRHVSQLLSYRHRLFKIGDRIGRPKNNNSKALEALNSEYLELSADMQQNDLVGDAFENEQYQFIKRQFDIENLRITVREELQLLLDESRNRTVAGFNFLSAIAVPFILIATLFQMGIVRFDSLLTIANPPEGVVLNHDLKVWLGWIVTIVLCVLSPILIRRFRRKK